MHNCSSVVQVTTMALGSLVTAAALVLVAAASLQLTAPAVPIGLPGCNTTCGNVPVPYSFGIQPGRYRPGFNLTCDTNRHGSPQLLLGDGSLRVVDIYPQNASVRVVRDGSMVNGTHTTISDGPNFTFASIFAGGHYRMSYLRNELVLFRCDMLATLVVGKIRGADGSGPIVIGCASFCGSHDFGGEDHYCSRGGCCQASYSETSDWYHMPTELHLRPLENRNNSDQDSSHDVSVFLAEEGWLDKWGQKTLHDGGESDFFETKNDIPLVLRWDIMQGLALSESDEKRDPYRSDQGCPTDVASLCKSKKSECTWDVEVYKCQCKEGYDGNPYVDNGCQDINECKNPRDNGCFGDCTNTDGSFECRCPSGTFGDATVRHNCVKIDDSSTAGRCAAVGWYGSSAHWAAKLRHHMRPCTCAVPFGFGPRQCYLPGFDLTCDKGHNPSRLLLGCNNSSLQVVGIFLNDSTAPVIHATTFDVTTTDKQVFDPRHKQVGIHFPNIGGPYMLSTRKNEFILTGCNIEATLHGTDNSVISSCVSNCTSGVIGDPRHTRNEYCSGRDGCCHAPISSGSRPKKVMFKQLLSLNISNCIPLPPLAFVAEEGQSDLWYMIFNRPTAYYYIRKEIWPLNGSAVRQYMASQVPFILFILRWVLKENISTSAQSNCWRQDGSYMCRCKNGFYGNPYIVGGCQDVDECKIPRIRNACYGDCNNSHGSYEYRCPQGTRGDPYKHGGCVESLKASTIGLLAASGPTLLVFVFGVILAFRKVKQRREKLLKLKYFKQNRGQLLQQLVSQRTDIAERMIITVDELAKATNNFDKARELGRGAHGTVYNGILSDQHVVAIKKSKITVQKEINEFINEVAILSQVNHRNVVKLLGCCLETEVPLLVYEFISNGTLYHHLHVEGPISIS